MATSTTYLSLRKPDTSDTVSVTTDVSNNMETIDGWFAPTVGSTQAMGDSAAAGSASTVSRSDHKHALPAFGAISSVSTSNSNGVATTIARSDHVHAIGTGAINATGMFGAGVVPAAALASWPRAHVYHSAGTQNISHNTIAPIAFDSEVVDTDSMHDNSTNNSRLTITTGGVYIFWAQVLWDSNTTGARHVFIRYDGAGYGIFGYSLMLASAIPSGIQVVVSPPLGMASGYVEVCVYQDSGGTRTVDYGQTAFGAIRICS